MIQFQAKHHKRVFLLFVYASTVTDGCAGTER